MLLKDSIKVAQTHHRLAYLIELIRVLVNFLIRNDLIIGKRCRNRVFLHSTRINRDLLYIAAISYLRLDGGGFRRGARAFPRVYRFADATSFDKRSVHELGLKPLGRQLIFVGEVKRRLVSLNRSRL